MGFGWEHIWQPSTVCGGSRSLALVSSPSLSLLPRPLHRVGPISFVTRGTYLLQLLVVARVREDSRDFIMVTEARSSTPAISSRLANAGKCYAVDTSHAPTQQPAAAAGSQPRNLPSMAISLLSTALSGRGVPSLWRSPVASLAKSTLN